jgi:hypothetical protein
MRYGTPITQALRTLVAHGTPCAHRFAGGEGRQARPENGRSDDAIYSSGGSVIAAGPAVIQLLDLISKQ